MIRIDEFDKDVRDVLRGMSFWSQIEVAGLVCFIIGRLLNFEVLVLLSVVVFVLCAMIELLSLHVLNYLIKEKTEEAIIDATDSHITIKSPAQKKVSVKKQIKVGTTKVTKKSAKK